MLFTQCHLAYKYWNETEIDPIPVRQVTYNLKYYTNLYTLFPDRIETAIFQLHGGAFGLLISCLETEILPFVHILNWYSQISSWKHENEAVNKNNSLIFLLEIWKKHCDNGATLA